MSNTSTDDIRMDMQRIIQSHKNLMIGRRFRHFKGGIYIVIDIAIHSESAEAMVVYKTFNDLSGMNCTWVRPLSMFLSKVDKNKYPDVKQEMRFQILDEEEVK